MKKEFEKQDMKKEYEKPQVEKIEFDYENAVVASGNGDNGKNKHPGQGCQV